MSFAGEVREELEQVTGSARHCQIAELTAIITMCGGVSISEKDRMRLRIHTENLLVARKFSRLAARLFSTDPECGVRAGRKNSLYSCVIPDHDMSVRILMATKLIDGEGAVGEDLSLTESVITQRACCRRAFLRGAFLVSGSVSDPLRSYHFEISCASPEKAAQIQNMISAGAADPKIASRRGHYVVYLKSGEQISDMLAAMGASKAVLRFENDRVLREVKGSVNRKVNCETANLHRTVVSSVRQIADIRFIQEHVGLDHLPEGLRSAALLRLDHPDAPLEELAKTMQPPIGKSGMNHRLRRLSAMADDLRRETEQTGADRAKIASKG